MPYFREQQSSATTLDGTISNPSLNTVFSGAALEKSGDIVADATESIHKLTIISDKERSEKSELQVLDNIEDKYSNKDQKDYKTDIKEVESKCQNEKETSINKKENSDDDSEKIIRGLSVTENSIINNEKSDKLQILMNRQISTNESIAHSFQYTSIPYMITSNTESGKLPLFSSWALTQLGSSSVYAHSSGVNQPGFVSNTRNLLPWDVPLKNTD